MRRTVPASLIRVRDGGQDREHFDQAELEQLAASIATDGILYPPIVRELADGTLELVAGERRTRAMRDVLGWNEITVDVRELTDEEAARAMLVENVNRVDLDPIAEARAYADRIDRFDATPAKIASECGISPARVRDRLKLLELSEHVAHFVATRQIPLGHAVLMVSLDKPRQALALQAYQDGAASIGVFREVCARLSEEQAAELASGMFDGDSFLQNPEWLAEVSDYVAPASEVEVVRESVLGLEEVGRELGIGLSQLRAMIRREAFPAPDMSVSRAPAWWASTVETWCADTGHGRPLTMEVAS
jgi:ParB/RepB/Spo0J family partition protein